MRIAIDAVGINKYGGGRTATLQLLQSIFKIDEENKYLVALSAARALFTGAAKIQFQLQPGVGAQNLVVPRRLCPTGAAGQPFAEYSGYPDADRRVVLCQYEPGVPVGSRHQFCGSNCTQSRKADA